MNEIYIDGACSGNPGPGGFAALFVQDGEPISQKTGSKSLTTNIEMEISALLTALKALDEGETAEVVTDSLNVVNWMTGAYKRKHQTVRDLCSQCDDVIAERKLKITYKWVRGHNGHPLNELVDKLAKSAIN